MSPLLYREQKRKESDLLRIHYGICTRSRQNPVSLVILHMSLYTYEVDAHCLYLDIHTETIFLHKNILSYAFLLKPCLWDGNYLN